MSQYTVIIQCEGATGQPDSTLNKSVTSYQLITLNEIMALISGSTEENTEFEVSNYLFLVYDQMKQPHAYI